MSLKQDLQKSLKQGLQKSFNPVKDFQIGNFFNFLVKKILSPKLSVTHREKQFIDFIQLPEFQNSKDNALQNQLLSKQTHTNIDIAWWAWLTVLSLDAPFVAIAWQALLTQSFELVLRPLHLALLFTTVWLIYVADRCFDSLVIDKAYTARHAFYIKYFRIIVLIASLIMGVVLIATLRWLEPTIFLHGALLSGVVLLYLANLHLLKKPVLLLPKELQIGIVFALGTGLSLWSQLDASNILLFSLATLCFAALCFLNCSFISLWERFIDAKHQQPSLARSSDVQNFSNLLQLAIISLCILSMVLPFDLSLKLAFVLSSIGLWIVNYTQISVKLKRVLADVVLMSPLLILIFSRLLST